MENARRTSAMRTATSESIAEREITLRLIKVIGNTEELRDLIKEVTALMSEWSGCEAVGIRLKEGDDFPYYETRGFPATFVQLERSLCIPDSNGRPICDSLGNPVLECMCGNVIQGRFNASLPFFTEGGSFWSNSTSDLLASSTEEDRQARTRNRCNGEGYESVALIPLRHGAKQLGLLQFNDSRRDRFDADLIALLECLAVNLSIGLAQRMATEEQLRSEMRLKEAQGIAKLASWSWHLASDRLLWSENMYDIYDIDKTRSPNIELLREAVLEEDLHLLDDALCSVSHRAAPRNIEYRIRTREGSIRHINVRVRIELDPEGHPIRLSGTVQDITDRKEAEQVLQNTQRLESLGIFAGGVAHDFNNLLGCLFGNIDLARVHVNDKHRVLRCLNSAMAALDRAKDLTRQLLTFSKGGIPNKTPVQLASLLRESRDLSLSGSTVECKFNLDKALPLVEADPNQLSQVFNNVLINARQAMPSGGRITVSAEVQDVDMCQVPGLGEHSYVKVTIQDQGTGIPSDHLPKVFDPFFTTKASGSGLGLSMCHAIIKKHSGAVTIDSQINVGTTVSIYLPTADESAKEERNLLHGMPEITGRILVMDDEESMCDVAVGMLELLGWETVCTRSGEEAVAAFKQETAAKRHFDLIFLDLTVSGGIGGEQTMREIRTLDPSVLGIVVSGYTDSPVLANPEKYGFAAKIEKPYNISNLKRVIAEALKKRPNHGTES
ncbi:MAG: ATP-binding protein [Myxococcota bacterium]|nr:ATP-binding protein [Myxococcota bacterium]